MSHDLERDLEATLVTLESLERYQEELVNDSVSMESLGERVDYLQVRRLRELESSVGMEGLDFQDVKDVFSAMGRATVAIGRGFMKFLDMMHRTIDTTHLVRLNQVRAKLKAIPAEDAKINKGRMERAKLAQALSISGDIPSSFMAYAKGATDFSRRTTANALPEMAMLSRQIGQRLEAKRWMGLDAFNAEVLEMVKIIGQFKLPMDRYQDQDFLRLYPGNRTIFKNIKPNRPRREPNISTAAARKVIEGLTATTVGIESRADQVRGKADRILPILTVEQALEMLDGAEMMLREARRVAEVAKAYRKDRVPSTSSMMLSGFYHGAKRQWDDIWTAQDDGFDVIEGAQGGHTIRHKPGTRNMLGGAVDKIPSMLSYEEPSLEAADPDQEYQQRTQMAVWVSRYLKLSLIDHQKTSQALILLLVGVARSYLDYVEESLDYYS